MAAKKTKKKGKPKKGKKHMSGKVCTGAKDCPFC